MSKKVQTVTREEAYALAMHDINNLAQQIHLQFQESSGGIMSIATAKEMAEKQWLYGQLWALANNARIVENKEETKGTKDGNRERANAAAAEL